MKRIAVIGGGGHAKVIISTVYASGDEVIAVFDDDLSLKGTLISGVTVCGPTTNIRPEEFDQAIIAIGTNTVRQKVAQSLSLPWGTAISPSAQVDPSLKIGEGTVVFAGAIIQPDTVIGKHVIINTGATIDHDCVIGDFVHIAPGVHLAGNVSLEAGVFLGIGSVVIPGKRIGCWTTIGAGAVVLQDIGERKVAYGVPARVKTE